MKYIKELDEDGNTIRPEFTEEEDAEYLRVAWSNFQNKVYKICNKFWTNDFFMAVGNREHFRSEMYPEYKVNRNPKNVLGKFVTPLRELAVYEGLAVFAQDREADDYIRTWAEECRQVGEDFIVCSVDKDLKCIPGKHYNPSTEKLVEVSEEEATRFFYEQLLMGDRTDNIPGLEGVGPIKAKRFLAECNHEKEYQKVVMDLYQAYYDDEWKDYLLSNAKLLYIQKHLNDFFSLEGW